MSLLDLNDKTPQEWDRIIAKELRRAGVKVRKFREYDTPHYSVKHTLEGRLGQWHFHRHTITYSFWGDVPLETAKVIAANKSCAEGSIPTQWFPGWSDRPDPATVHANYNDYVTWVAEGMFLTKDTGESEVTKQIMQKDRGWKLRFVSDPSDPKEKGKPLIQSYTFFTLEALHNFVLIAKRQQLEFSHTY